MNSDGTDIESMRIEMDRLRRKVDELEQRVQAADAQAALYQATFEDLPVPAALYRADGILTDINRRNREMLAVPSKEAMVGKHNMFEDPVAIGGGYTAHFERVVRSGEPVIMAPTPYDTAEAGIERVEDRTVWTETRMSPVDVGGARYVVGINLDATARMRAEQAQAATLRALSTPLLPIARGVVVMPLVGAIDAPRAEQVLEILLQGIVTHQASMVILDVTGVLVVDTYVARALVTTARAVSLLGAQAVLTGIQPTTARTLVEMGADLGGILVRSTLESGIAYALARDDAGASGRGPRK
jgi:anti-anti-sigma regulatory factor